MKTRIEMLQDGRFVSHHLGAEVYHDSRHKVIKTAVIEGVFMELILARQENESFKPQMISYISPEGLHTIIDIS